MVKGMPLIFARVGAFTFAAVLVESPPSHDRPAATEVSFVWDGKVEASVDVLGVALGSISTVAYPLPRPLIAENSRIAIYLTGPQSTTVTTSPRSDSASEVVRHHNFQHIEIRYRGAVGDVSWRWDTPFGAMTIQMECFPTKIDFRRDFEAIRAELQELAPTLTASAAGAAGAGYAPWMKSQDTPLEWLEMVRRSAQRLIESMEQLLPRLRPQLETSVGIVMADRLRGAKPVSRRSYGTIANHRSTLQAHTLRQSESTPINGYLRWEVDRLRSMAQSVVSASWFTKIDANLAVPVYALAQAAEEWRLRLISVRPVHHVPSLHVRLRDPLYERAFRDLRLLWLALQPLRDSEPVGLKDLPTMYEYWVFLRIAQILKTRFPTVIRNSDPLIKRAGSQLVMTAGSKSIIVLADSSGRRIKCQYRRLFLGLPTTDQEPDAIIEVEDGTRFLMIDAKYRIGQDHPYLARYGLAGPLADDVNVLHRYRDAIVSKEPPHIRLGHAGLIAFPGVEREKYRYHRFYMSWLSVGVGGIPMLPSGTALMEEAINDYLDKRLEGTAA